MKYYTTKQVAEMFNISEGTVIHRRKAGQYPHATQPDKGTKWAYPECCVSPGSVCLKGGDGSLPEAQALVKMEAETAKMEAEKRHADAKAKRDEAYNLRDLPEILKAREEALEVERRQLDSKIESHNRKVEEVRVRGDVLNRMEVKINEWLKAIKKRNRECLYDLRLMGKCYNEHSDFVKGHYLPKIKELTLPVEVYIEAESITIDIVPDLNLFEEKEEEQDSGDF